MISKLALTAKKVIDAAWLHGPSYDLSSQAAFALESSQLLQSPETAAEVERLRAELAQRTQDLADVHADREKLRARVDEVVAQRDDLLVESATAPDPTDGNEPFVPRTEREYWAAIADALNAAAGIGMPVGIDLDGTLTDHTAWSVVWDRDTEQWTVAGYEDDDASTPPADGITQLIAPVQALREESPAAHLAGLLSGSQPDVTAAEVLDDHTIRLTVRPHDYAAWSWWLTRLRVNVATITARGAVTTGTGEHQGVTVHLLGEGMTGLMLAARDGEDR
ncbi:hypothetical protein [Streptomyces sp. NBRC 110035]|uniref:hypothetical protein n=1 Tax=Streptomyces sp. NBRC 110035 TaxID=1547867 RepID=UPI0005A6F56F|nr:hypothetical protein [Streptomyces sp. NBRC 110035]